MANSTILSDDELRRELQSFGQDVGLLSDSTRNVWLKKLTKLRAESKKVSKVAPVSKRLIGFSSDESDNDSDQPKPRSPRKGKGRNTVTAAKRGKQRAQSNNPVPSSSFFEGTNGDDFKEPVNPPKSGKLRSGTAGAAGEKKVSRIQKTFDQTYDKDSASSSHLSRPSLRRSVDIFSLPSPPNDNFDSTDAETDVDDSFSNRHPPIMFSAETNTSPGMDRTIGSNLSNHRSPYNNEGWVSSDELQLSPRSSFPSLSAKVALQNFRESIGSTISNAPPSTRRRQSQNHNNANTNNDLLDEDKIRQCGFKTGDESVSYSQYFSLVLLIFVAAFFVILGATYYLKWSHGDFLGGIVQKRGNKSPAHYAENLIDHLSQLKGDLECGKKVNPRLTTSEAKTYLRNHFMFDPKENNGEDWDDILQKIQENAKHIRVLNRDGKDVEKISDIRHLEWDSTQRQPHRSLICRLKNSTKQVMTSVLIVAAVMAVSCTIWALLRYRRLMKDKETRQVYTLVEQIIDLLKQHADACQKDKELQPYVPIPHARDVLIPMKDRQKMMKLWEKAVHFLDANESRVRIEIQTIEGEEFECWRWLQTCSNSGRKVWQGQAFGEHADQSMNTIPYSPTPCLKVRSMFDQEMECGEDWHVSIQDAILEKCSTTCPDGIVHMVVDKTSKEGCVYIMCSSREAAGLCFKSLHGWWFDGQLVTVKFLRLERYYQRFPQAQNIDETQPMKPSNNERKSLSEPFHRSALECS